MNKIFISFRFTGEDPNHLDYVLGNMRDSLTSAGHQVTCSFYYDDFFKQNRMSTEQIYSYMLEKQEESDVFMALVKSIDKSKGMTLESEKAKKLGQRYILIKKKELYVPEFEQPAHEIITYDNFPELFEILKQFR